MFRSISFIVKGKKEFTNAGYYREAKAAGGEEVWDKELQDVDMSGRSAMVTGANSGIGLSTTRFFLQKGAVVHMICRNPDKGEKARSDLISELGVPEERAVLHVVDMSETGVVKSFAQNFTKSDHPLDILVNNAGCMVHKYQLTKHGHELNFATNSLGTYVLTEELVPKLSQSSDARVVTVASGGMYTEDLEIDDLQSEKRKNDKKFDATPVYAKNKRHQVAMGESWAKKYAVKFNKDDEEKESKSFTFQTMHPGWSDTPAVKEAMPRFYDSLKPSLRTPQQGADTLQWLGSNEKAKDFESGQFFLDRKPQSKHLWGVFSEYNDEQRETLMEKLKELSDGVEVTEEDNERFSYLLKNGDDEKGDDEKGDDK